MQFMGDQGRDAILVRNMLVNHHPALIGPVTSVGNMYLGPFYYYFMLLPLMLSYPDPSGPAFAVGLVGIVTLVLIYQLGKKMLGEKTALIATALYAVSPLVIQNVRFSWNPNIVPCFSLLFCWFLYRALKGREKSWIWVGLTFSILIQLHYITLILGAVAGGVWIFKLTEGIRKKHVSRDFILSTVLAIAIFLVSLAPLLAFDIRHQFINSRAFLSFFQGNGDHFRLLGALPNVSKASMTLFVRNIVGLFSVQATGTLKFIFFAVVVSVLSSVFVGKKRPHMLAERLLIVIFTFSCVMLALYRTTVYDHYLAFLYPLGTLVLAMILSQLSERAILRPLAALCFVALIGTSLLHQPFKENLGYNIDMMKRTADEIQSRLSPGEKYNIFLYSPSHDFQGMNYRYFLTTMPLKPESEDKFFNFESLYIIDDDRTSNILDTKHYQIAVWTDRTILDQFDIPGGPTVYKLHR